MENPRTAPKTALQALQRGQEEGRITGIKDGILRGVVVGTAIGVSMWLGTTWYWRLAIFALIMFLIGVAFSAYHRSKDV